MSLIASAIRASSELEYVKFFQTLIFNKNNPIYATPCLPGATVTTVVGVIHDLYFMRPESFTDPSLALQIMTAYGGSLSVTDRSLLRVLRKMDAIMNLNSMAVIVAYGFNHRAASGNHDRFIGAGLDGAGEVKFDGRMVSNSVRQLSRTILNKKSNDDELHEIYDPEFTLPAIADMVARNLVEFKQLIDNNLLGYVIVCLTLDGTSYFMAKKILVQLINDLQESKFKERDLIRSLLYKLFNLIHEIDNHSKHLLYLTSDHHDRQSLANNGNKISAVFATLLAGITTVISNPGHFLFDTAVKFVTGHAEFSIRQSQAEIPLLRELIPNTNVDEQVKHTNWMLHVLIGGLKSEPDLKLYQKNFVIEIALSVESNAFAADSTRRLVRELIEQGRTCK
ncbi:hypothetical protein V1514DRAFT_282563 [Lipomyces japonicus]|uniref:uncharacterized protein n=1 Tax=Lipomyces japonicus TaxID=56871 RepID=UPI0034CE3568